MNMIYIVETADERIGKFGTLSSAKLSCLSHFRSTNWSYYTIKVYNPKYNRVTKTHYSYCSYYRSAGCDFCQIFLDYGRNRKHYVK